MSTRKKQRNRYKAILQRGARPKVRTEDRIAALERIISLGAALTIEADSNRLLELILKEAKEITQADGGSLYLKGKEDDLEFKIVFNDTLGFAQGGEHGPITLPPVKLYDEDGQPNFHNVVSCAYHRQQTIVVDDAYQDERFDFSGTRKFDSLNGYRSTSFLTVPFIIRNNEIIGALQLINAQQNGDIIPFHDEVRSLVEALAAQAAAVLYLKNLLEMQNRLFDAFIQLIAGAIDTKSPYTGGHCARVPEIALMIAREAEKMEEGPFRDFHFSNSDEWRAFRIGAWLHDCGKMTTPEYVVDKSVKLETIHNRIHEIRTRFEVLLRDARIRELEEVAQGVPAEQACLQYLETQARLEEEYSFVAESNLGSESMDESRITRLVEIGARQWYRTFDATLGLSWEEAQRLEASGVSGAPGWENILADQPWHKVPLRKKTKRELYSSKGFKLPQTDCLYNHGELYNLSIKRGTLTAEERFKINEHIMQTIVMLEELPFPTSLQRVPEFAGTHHETLRGNGYPRGLDAEALSLPSRMMMIADIYEALTASDRPYKKAKKLSEAIDILYKMKCRGDIDAELFELFLTSGVYLEYAEQYLQNEQNDHPDISRWLDRESNK